MLKNIPAMYNEHQYAEFEAFISNICGEESIRYVFHEIESEYIHTDVYVAESSEDLRTYMTVGMSCKDLNPPDDTFKNIELMCFTSTDFEISSDDSALIANELVAISKYPFRENTWLGNMHTINTSPKFKHRFGYDYFMFIYGGMTTNISDTGEVSYLNLIPLYAKEYEWIIKNGPESFLTKLIEKYEVEAFTINKSRDIIVSSDTI